MSDHLRLLQRQTNHLFERLFNIGIATDIIPTENRIPDFIKNMFELFVHDFNRLRYNKGQTTSRNAVIYSNYHATYKPQMQADRLSAPVIRPKTIETTALGAAMLAGLAVGFWTDLNQLQARWQEDKQFVPQMAEIERTGILQRWQSAIDTIHRTL